MLHDIEVYKAKSLEMGIPRMSYPIYTIEENPKTGETNGWAEVTNFQLYMDKCYDIAQKANVKFEEIINNLNEADKSSKKDIEMIYQQVINLIDALNQDNISYKNEKVYNPIDHISEQLSELLSEIEEIMVHLTVEVAKEETIKADDLNEKVIHLKREEIPNCNLEEQLVEMQAQVLEATGTEDYSVDEKSGSLISKGKAFFKSLLE